MKSDPRQSQTNGSLSFCPRSLYNTLLCVSGRATVTKIFTKSKRPIFHKSVGRSFDFQITCTVKVRLCTFTLSAKRCNMTCERSRPLYRNRVAKDKIKKRLSRSDVSTLHRVSFVDKTVRAPLSYSISKSKRVSLSFKEQQRLDCFNVQNALSQVCRRRTAGASHPRAPPARHE